MRLLFFLVFVGDFLYVVTRSPIHPAPNYHAYLLVAFFAFVFLSIIVKRARTIGLGVCALLLGAMCGARGWDAREATRIIEPPDWQWHKVYGVVVDIPIKTQYGWSWQAQIDQLCDEDDHCRDWSHRLRFNDSTKRAPPQIGEQWLWVVRVKPSHGSTNPGLLMREQFDWYNQIDGYASLNRKIPPQFLAPARGYYLDRLRAALAQRILLLVPDAPNVGLILGLILGIRDHITQKQWQLVRANGTSHLLAISGLHVALVASMAYFVSHFLWRCSAKACLMIAAPRVGWIVAWIVAAIYSALAGFAIPTVRSLIMISAFMVTQIGYRVFPKGYGLLLALALVIIWDPLAPLSLSFILSFGAVAALTMSYVPKTIQHSNWKRLLHTQWVATIGLLPVTIWLFRQFSMVGMIANLVAIPYVGWFSVPLCFAAFISLWLPRVSYWLFHLADISLAWLFLFFEKLANIPHAVWLTVLPSPWLMWFGMMCVVILITQNRKRWLMLAGVGLILSLYLSRTHPAQGELWVTVLDVGQGLSILVQTQHHVLVFDTGPKYPGGLDNAEKVVLPVLRYYGWKKIDTMIVSHGDNDHAGGAKTIIKQFPKLKVFTSVPEKFLPFKSEYCHAGIEWRWDDVEFRILHPDSEHTFKGNNASCVLKIQNASHQILLPGDIEARGEQWLVDHDELNQLKSTVLVAAHHGSKTSSTEEWIEQVHPKIVVFSTGFLNRFHFPNKLIVERYENAGIKMLDTADSGAIEFKFGKELKIKRQRDQRCLFNLC